MIESFNNSQTILHEIGKGNADAFHQLFNTYWNKVYSTAFMLIKLHEQAEDITQEVFLKLWQKRESLADVENLDNFLFITTRNFTFNRMRRMKLEDAYTNYLLHTTPGILSDADQLAEYHELQNCINEGILQLPPQQQKAFKLSRENGFTHEQIAREMNITRETAKGYIVRSIAFLRRYLKEHALALITLLISRSV
ncbi:MAG: RNA polymerase sigma-70 factor [Chitinophagaceae bacterium]|nr:RNA polymerase sigma-70 factor [Chitinophagaceae bacterium]